MENQPRGRMKATLLEIGLAVAAIFIAVLYFSARSAHAAEGEITALFGSVLKVDSGSKVISLATDDAVIELKTDSDTTIRIGEVSATIADVAVGDRLAATAIKLSDGTLLGKSILIKPKEGTQVRHVVGIVIAAENGRATILDRDGNTVTFDLPAGVTAPGLGEAITAITRRDLVTNRIEAKGLSRANEIIDRLQAQLDEIRDRQEIEAIERAARLRGLLEDTARNHLGVLAQAAGTVKDDADRYAERVRKGAQEQLDALRAKYQDEIGKRGGKVQDIQVQGTIGAISETSITLQLRGGGEVDFEITSATKFAVKGIGDAELSDVAVNDYAFVEFDPEGDPNRPVARRVVVTEPRLRKDVAANLEAGRIEQFDGVITHVELETKLDNVVAVVIVVNDERGVKIAAKVAPDTEIFIDGKPAKAAELKPGLRAAVSIEPEGLIAKAIRAYAADENHRKIEGVIRRIDRDNRIIAIAPERGELVVVSVADDSKIVKDDKPAGFDDLEINDLVLGGTRYEAATGEIVRLIVRSPRFRAEGVISGVSATDHTVTLRPRKGDPVTLIVTDETVLESKDGGKIGFDAIRSGLTAIAAWRAAVVDGAVRNIAISIVVGRPEIETVRGHVRKLDAAAGVLVVETGEGRVIELRLPRDGEHKPILIKDDHPIDSLRPVNIGDEVHKAAYVPDGNVIVSLVVVTPKAVQVRGQIQGADAARGFLKIAVSNEKAIVVAVNNESVITYKGERVTFERLASVVGTARLAIVALYTPTAAPSGADGVLLRGEVILLGEPAKQTQPTPRVEVNISGTLRQIEGEIWVVNDVKFKVVEGKTKVDGKPVVGALVKARLEGERENLVAVEVVVREVPAKPEEQTGRPTEVRPVTPGRTPTPTTSSVTVITGVIQEISGNVWLVRDHKFVRNDRTVVHGEPKVGAAVKMAVRREGDGTLLIVEASVAGFELGTAATNRVEPKPVATAVTTEVSLEGSVDAVDGTTVLLAGQKVFILPHVLEKVEKGMRLHCVVRKNRDGSAEALKCAVLKPLETTTVVPAEESVEGTVEATDGSTVLLAGRKVIGVGRLVERVEKGMRLHCVVRKNRDGSYEALKCTVLRQAEVAATAVPQLITMTGVLEVIEGRTWVVNGRKLFVAENVRIEGNPRVGAKVKLLVRIDRDLLVVASAAVVEESTSGTSGSGSTSTGGR